MVHLLLYRGTVLYVAVMITALWASSASAADEAVAKDNSFTNATRRYLQKAETDYHITMLNAVNKARTDRGLAKLCMNIKLQEVAQVHSTDMARHRFVSHTGSDGSTVKSRAQAAGYRWTDIGENVAAGQATVSSVISSWMKSSGHRANILNPRFKVFGCAYAYTSSSKYKHYWTQSFGSAKGEVCG